jgi:hypothetical protein
MMRIYRLLFQALPISGALLMASGALLMAADATWLDKPIPSWTDADARQVLTDSPWCRLVIAGITRRQNEDERRAGGNMGQATGVGFDGVDDVRPKVQIPNNIIDFLVKPTPYVPPPPKYMRLRIRWESALPVRAAELKYGVLAPPTLDVDGYTIAVYGIPGEFFKDPTTLGKPLKDLAVLKRDGKKDVKPASAEVFQRENGVVVVYMFPPSMEITKQDGHVDFEAQIGRLVFTHTFDLDEMQFEGKLAL